MNRTYTDRDGQHHKVAHDSALPFVVIRNAQPPGAGNEAGQVMSRHRLKSDADRAGAVYGTWVDVIDTSKPDPRIRPSDRFVTWPGVAGRMWAKRMEETPGKWITSKQNCFTTEQLEALIGVEAEITVLTVARIDLGSDPDEETCGGGC